jgi:hypothetical protein
MTSTARIVFTCDRCGQIVYVDADPQRPTDMQAPVTWRHVDVAPRGSSMAAGGDICDECSNAFFAWWQEVPTVLRVPPQAAAVEVDDGSPVPTEYRLYDRRRST